MQELKAYTNEVDRIFQELTDYAKEGSLTQRRIIARGHMIKAIVTHSRECPHADCHELLYLPPGELKGGGVYLCPSCCKPVRVYGNRMQWDVATLSESWVE